MDYGSNAAPDLMFLLPRDVDAHHELHMCCTSFALMHVTCYPTRYLSTDAQLKLPKAGLQAPWPLFHSPSSIKSSYSYFRARNYSSRSDSPQCFRPASRGIVSGERPELDIPRVGIDEPRLDLIRCASLLSRDEEPPGTSLVGSECSCSGVFRATSLGCLERWALGLIQVSKRLFPLYRRPVAYVRGLLAPCWLPS